MLTETKKERLVLCNLEGKILYVSDDLMGRIPNALQGVNLSSFLGSLERARFDAFCLSGSEPRITLPVTGIRGMTAVSLEKTSSGFGTMIRCTFASREADLAPEARTLHPHFLYHARERFEAEREKLRTLLAEPIPDTAAMGHCFESLYRDSMLFLAGTEMFFSHTERKYLRPLTSFMETVVSTVRDSVRYFGSDLTLRSEEDAIACFEVSSFAALNMALLSVLNDLSESHAITVETEMLSDGARILYETACDSTLALSDRRLAMSLFSLPEETHMRLYLCDVIAGAQGFSIRCTAEAGKLCFTLHMPDTRLGGEYLKNNPFLPDIEGICHRYAALMFGDGSGAVGQEQGKQ